MKIKCIFLLHLFLISTYSNGDQIESDLTKVSKQIQLTAEIKKNNRTFGDIKFESFSPAFKVLTWSPKDDKFLDLQLLFKASYRNPLDFDITLANPAYACVDPDAPPRNPPSERLLGSLQYKLIPENKPSRKFNNYKAAIKLSDWPEDRPYVNFTVQIIFGTYFAAPRICKGGLTIIFSASP